jgi:hypothetical protein
MPVSRQAQYRSLELEFPQEAVEYGEAVRPGGNEFLKDAVGDFRQELGCVNGAPPFLYRGTAQQAAQ